MAARKSKLASSVQDLTIEMPREYLDHALCKQVNIANNQSFVSELTGNIVEPWVMSWRGRVLDCKTIGISAKVSFMRVSSLSSTSHFAKLVLAKSKSPV